MRIIAGKYKGRQLFSAKDQSIRPTTSKIKEYIFQLLGGFVEASDVLDLFSGSGSLGLEALSRGASSVTFVDNAQTSLRVLRRNIGSMQVEEPIKVIRKDVITFLRTNKKSFDLIFTDPPFKWSEFDRLMPLMFNNKNLTEMGLLVMESERTHDIVWEGENWKLLRQKQFDRSIISFICRKTAT